jgi:hypothetical protein
MSEMAFFFFFFFFFFFLAMTTHCDGEFEFPKVASELGLAFRKKKKKEVRRTVQEESITKFVTAF